MYTSHWRRKWQPTPVFLSGESHGQRAWWAAVHGVTQSQTRLKRLSMHACIGEGNGNPLHCSCLENPSDRGVWWAAAIYGVAQSQTKLKWLSSSSSIPFTDLVNIKVIYSKPNWSHGSQPCLTQWNYQACCARSPKTDGSWWRVLIKCGPLEKKGNGKPLQYSCLENPMNSMKRQKDKTL